MPIEYTSSNLFKATWNVRLEPKIEYFFLHRLATIKLERSIGNVQGHCCKSLTDYSVLFL